MRVSADSSEVTIVPKMLLVPSPTRMRLFEAATPTLASIVIEDVQPVYHRIAMIFVTPVRVRHVARFGKQLSEISPTIFDPT